MKKLFISQPMKGKTNEEILKTREEAIRCAEKLLQEPALILESFFEDAPAEVKPLWFLGKSLEVLSKADLAVFAPGWKDARGCRIEHLCAGKYGIECLELEESAENEKEV